MPYPKDGAKDWPDMSKKRAEPTPASVTAERAGRLFRMLTLLAAGPQSRTTLTRRLRLGVRGFYRDLEVLREVGINVSLTNGKYSLLEDAAAAIARLPFPDPGLTLGEARQLARGRNEANKKIRQQLHKIEH
jgi:predicted DNA-binding transcriptional regulator YafY